LTVLCGGLTFDQCNVVDAGTALPTRVNLISAAFAERRCVPELQS
jgi:hypothetical protein